MNFFPMIQTRETALSLSWNKEVDVVVIGYGGAGAVSAITAHDAGAKTLILEKMEQGLEGGNTRVSAGIVFSPDDAEAAQDYIRALSEGVVDEEVIKTMATAMSENAAYLISLGADPTRKIKRSGGTFPNLPGSEKCAISYYTPGNGQGLFNLLANQVSRRRIEVLYGTPGKALIQNRGGEILGVAVGDEARTKLIKARRAVILTCGGFLFDRTMQKDYLSAWPYLGFGSPGNTGDGVRMAQKAGASLWHMSCVLGPLSPALKLPGSEVPLLVSIPGDGYVFLDKHGRRFMNEKKDPFFGKGWQEVTLYDPAQTEFPRIPWTILFDDTTRKKGPLVPSSREILLGGHLVKLKNTWAMVMEERDWSTDNSREIEKGWIAKGATLPELAEILGIQSDDLDDSIARYNSFCGTGKDADFSRPSGTLRPIASPPFYAIKVYPGAISTQGGPRRNEHSQVLDPFERSIPRLYAAGECGSVWGFLYQASGNLADCIAFGRIAGRNAAHEKPWD